MPLRPHVALACGAVLWTLAVNPQGQARDPATPGELGISSEEMELLDSGRKLRDYPCSIRLNEPVLGFDYRFHAGFRATIPLRHLVGEEMMTLIYRVRSLDGANRPLFYRNGVEVPGGEQGRNLLLFGGEFSLGEGEYQLDLALAGASGAVCTSRFEFESRRARRGKRVPLTLPPGEIAWAAHEVSRVWPRSDSADPLRFKILVNVPPFRNSSKPLTADDVAYLLSFLKYFGERAPLKDVALTAFNLKEQRIVHRQPPRPWLSLADLGRSLGGVESNQMISVDALRKDGVTNFLSQLIDREVRGADADAVLFLGPLGFRGENLKSLARELSGRHPPLYYLRYRFRAAGPTFGDPIRDFVREAGGESFEIADPYQLYEAVEEILEELEGPR